jgi:MFS family permease
VIQAVETPYASGRYATYVVFVLLLAFFMSFLDRQIITLLLPALKADLGVSDTQVSLIQGLAFASLYAVTGLSMGWIADHMNRRNLIVAGIVFWTLATVACGLAENFWQLFVARMAVGMGEACLGPACASIMADYVRPAQRGRAMGAMMTGAPFGAAGSLFIGGVLLTSLTHGAGAALVPEGWAPWRIVFVAIAAPGLLVALLVATLKEPLRREGPTTFQAGPSQISLVGFFRDHPVTVALFFGIISCLAMAASALSSWAPTVLMRIYGMAPTQAGGIYGTIMLICAGAAGVCSGVASDALVKRWRLSGRVLIPVFLLPMEMAAQAVLIMANSAALVVAAMSVSAFILAFIGATYFPIIQDLFPNQLRGRAVAFLGLVGTVFGLGCGPTLVALVTDHVFRDEMMLQRSIGIVDLIAVSLGFLLALWLPRSYAKARRNELESPQPDASLAAATAS